MSEKDYVLDIFIKEPNQLDIPDDYIKRYKKFVETDGVLEGLLLGDFVDGEYVLKDEIKKELVRRTKIVTEWVETGVKADLLVLGVTYHMELEIESFDENQNIATLYLIEKFFDEELKTYVADYVSEKSPTFRDEAMLALHIVVEGDEADKDDEGEIAKRVYVLKNKNDHERKFVVEMYSELYVLRMLKLLASCGDLGKKILEEYAEEIKRKGYTGNITPELYIKLRRILDKTIEKNGGLVALIKENPQIKLAIKEFLDPIEYYEKVVSSKPVFATKKEDVKSKPKTAEKASSSSKAKKSASKKADKKKDDKKKAAKKKDEPKAKVKGRYIPKKEASTKAPTVVKPGPILQKVFNKSNERNVINEDKTIEDIWKGILDEGNLLEKQTDEAFNETKKKDEIEINIESYYRVEKINEDKSDDYIFDNLKKNVELDKSK